MRRVFSVFLLSLLTISMAYSAPGKMVVRFGDMVRTIDSSTSCEKKRWGNNLANSCQCCLVKEKLRNHNAQTAIKHCKMEKKYCTDPVLSSLQTQYNPQAQDMATLIDSLYQSVTLLPIVGDQIYPRALDDRGVINLLQTAKDQNYIPNTDQLPNFNKSGCFKIKNLKQSDGGANTLQLFNIFYNPQCDGNDQNFQSVYILKEMKKAHEEVRNLERIAINFTRSVPNVNFSFPIANFGYQDEKGQIHFMSLMPTAKGSTLAYWEKEYAEKRLSQEELANIFYNFGVALASLHLAYMEPQGAIFGKTVTHGDAHFENYFATREGEGTFIDNETMEKSLSSRQKPDFDLINFYINQNLNIDKSNARFRQKSISGLEWHQLIMKPFLQGYVKTYTDKLGGGSKINVVRELKKVYLNQSLFGILNKTGVFINPIRYKRYQKYISDILAEIVKNPAL